MFSSRSIARGFTLIELLVVLSVLSILALAALPVAELTHKRVKEKELRSALATIRNALDDYKHAYDAGRIAPKSGTSGYPESLRALVNGVDDVKDPRRIKLYFLRRVPRDPFAAPDIPADQTWGLRSYASPPDEPKAGDDVYDIYSQSATVGLNGLPYKQW